MHTKIDPTPIESPTVGQLFFVCRRRHSFNFLGWFVVKVTCRNCRIDSHKLLQLYIFKETFDTLKGVSEHMLAQDLVRKYCRCGFESNT